MLPAPRAILFDWDNTLVDTWPIIHAALEATFQEFGLAPWSLEQVKARVKKSMRDSFPEIFGPEWESAGAAYQAHYRTRHLERLTPLPGAADLLHALAGQGVPMAVVSNKKGDNLRQEVAHLSWGKFFGGIVGSGDASHDKPHTAPVALALSHLSQAGGADVWFIGDSDIDLDCAARAGLTAVLYGEYAAAQPTFTPTHYEGFPYAHYAAGHDALMQVLHTTRVG